MNQSYVAEWTDGFSAFFQFFDPAIVLSQFLAFPSLISLVIAAMVFPLAVIGSKQKNTDSFCNLIFVLQISSPFSYALLLPAVYAGPVAYYCKLQVAQYIISITLIFIQTIASYWTMYVLKRYYIRGRLIVLLYLSVLALGAWGANHPMR